MSRNPLRFSGFLKGAVDWIRPCLVPNRLMRDAGIGIAQRSATIAVVEGNQ